MFSAILLRILLYVKMAATRDRPPRMFNHFLKIGILFYWISVRFILLVSSEQFFSIFNIKILFFFGWDFAEVVIRLWPHNLDRFIIDNHSGDIVSWMDSPSRLMSYYVWWSIEILNLRIELSTLHVTGIYCIQTHAYATNARNLGFSTGEGFCHWHNLSPPPISVSNSRHMHILVGYMPFNGNDFNHALWLLLRARMPGIVTKLFCIFVIKSEKARLWNLISFVMLGTFWINYINWKLYILEIPVQIE